MVMLFESYFTFESRFRWHRLIITVESTREIRTLVVVFESLEEMFVWNVGMVSLTNNFKFCRLLIERKVHRNSFVCISDGFRSACSIYICYASS